MIEGASTGKRHKPPALSLDVREIPKMQAVAFIRQYHYSKVMPRLNKYFVGFFVCLLYTSPSPRDTR